MRALKSARAIAACALLAVAALTSAPAIAEEPVQIGAQVQTVAYSPELLSSYIADRNAATLSGDVTFSPEHWLVGVKAAPTVDDELLSAYAETYVPTATKIANMQEERLCLAQAIYHEARGEDETGQWAVANVVLNRVMSKRFPNSICGVVFQNADRGKFKCQFSFACDGRSDMGGYGNRIVRESWVKSNLIAYAAFNQYQKGERLNTLPSTVLFYHTTNVAPSWSLAFRAVTQIGSHIFYSPS